MINNVLKRDSSIQAFNSDKILFALNNLLNSEPELKMTYSQEFLKSVVETVVKALSEDFNEQTPTTQDVSTIVEHVLMQQGAYDLAKSYIVVGYQKEQVLEKQKNSDMKKLESDKLTVTKSNGEKELFDISKVERAFNRANINYKSKCKFGEIKDTFKTYLVDGITTSKILELLTKTCIDQISVENTAWQFIAARLQLFSLYKKAGKNRGLKFTQIYSPESYKALFDDYIAKGLYYKDFYKYYTEEDILEAGKAIQKKTDLEYGYPTVTMLGKRYLLNPNKKVHELPQEMYMSVALFLAINEKPQNRLKFAIEIYNITSTQQLSLPTPTLMNARTNFTQLSSCFVLNSGDDLREIYHNIENIAQISKLGGGVGIYLGNIRSQGASIRGVENSSGGVLPWVKVLNDTAVAVDQLGQRSGAVSVTLDIWHKDIFDFLDMQTETGDIRRKSLDVFPAVSVPDLFMQRVEENGTWTLFDPHEVETKLGVKINDFFGLEFTETYEWCETQTSKLKLSSVVQARDLFKVFLKNAVETGMPYVFFRDTVNKLNPNKHKGNVYSTQLCTEITQNTSPSKYIEETSKGEDGSDYVTIKYKAGDNVVCNLASINVAKVNSPEQIAYVVPLAMRVLDNVVSLNLYPVKETEITSKKYRAVGLGYLGLAEYFATNKIMYDSPEAVKAAGKLFEQFALHAIKGSAQLAEERGTYELYEGSEWSKGNFMGKNREWFNTEGNTELSKEWNELLDYVERVGVRNGYMMSPAPNTSTSSIVGTTAGLLPIYKKYFVESNGVAPLVTVAPNLSSSNFWFYKEYVNMNTSDVIDVIAEVYKWVDQAISFEWMINPATTSPKDVYELYFKAWRKGIKTVYYVRSQSAEVKENCVSCSG